MSTIYVRHKTECAWCRVPLHTDPEGALTITKAPDAELVLKACSREHLIKSLVTYYPEEVPEPGQFSSR